MPPQVAERTAGVAALVAAVRLLPRVGAGVALQVDELGRGVGADGAAVRLLAVVGPHVAFEVVGVARGEGAQGAGVQLGGDVGTTGCLSAASPFLVGAAADGSVRQVRLLHLRGVEGDGVLEAFLTGQTVKLCPQIETHP